jgi:hypothetical protein
MLNTHASLSMSPALPVAFTCTTTNSAPVVRAGCRYMSAQLASWPRRSWSYLAWPSAVQIITPRMLTIATTSLPTLALNCWPMTLQEPSRPCSVSRSSRTRSSLCKMRPGRNSASPFATLRHTNLSSPSTWPLVVCLRFRIAFAAPRKSNGVRNYMSTRLPGIWFGDILVQQAGSTLPG